jgi:hypothetical protein
MTQPYEFFPGAAPQAAGAGGAPVSQFGSAAPAAPSAAPGPAQFSAPAAPMSQFGGPATPTSPYGGSSGPVASTLPVAARPGLVSVLAGLLIAQAALAAGPAVSLLLLRDVIGRVMDAFASGFGGASGLTPTESQASTSGMGGLTMWGVGLLLVTVLSALSAVAVLDRRAWAVLTAGLTEVGLLICGVAHFGSWATVSTIAVLFAVAIGALLAAPDVRRWTTSG